MAVLDAGVGWAFSPGFPPEDLHGPLRGLGSHGTKGDSERNIPREHKPECPVRNCKASYNLVLVPSETSAAAGIQSMSPGTPRLQGRGLTVYLRGEMQGHLAEKHVGWKMLWPSLENAICHLQSLKVH